MSRTLRPSPLTTLLPLTWAWVTPLPDAPEVQARQQSVRDYSEAICKV
ncbi:hypothetical protein DESA109040_08605 [Deinococcus saxicola]